MTNTTPITHSSRQKKYTLLCIFIVVVLALVGSLYAYEHRGQDRTHTATNTSGTVSPNTKGEPSGTSTENTVPGDNKSTEGSNSSTTTTLQEPQCNFVSNHNPSLSGKDTPSIEQSVCNTTPGADCQIIFTKGDITKSLPTQTTDKGGATYWTWTPQDIGLTVGAWQVSAKATLGSQTKTANDAVPLEVKQ